MDIHVGKKLKAQRMLAGMSQEAFAKMLGVTFQQVQKYERGVNRMGASRIHEAAKILKVPVNFFFDDFEDASGKKKYGMADDDGGFEYEDISSKENIDLIREYAKIKDPKMKKKVLEIIKSVAQAS